MGNFKINIEKFGDSYLLINWPNRIDVSISEELLQFNTFINQKLNCGIIETNNTYTSICVRFDPSIVSYIDLEKTLMVTYQNFSSAQLDNYSTWEIPVCYHRELAPDLESFCRKKEISKKTLIEWHTSPEYRVYFLGFLPGFLYLGGMDKRLNLERKSTPRQSVPKGAVGIAGNQTGVYPQASPGGWNLIGRSPAEFFSLQQSPPISIKPNDRVKFKSISIEMFNNIQLKVKENTYSLNEINTQNDG